jgi:hypothetical protein
MESLEEEYKYLKRWLGDLNQPPKEDAERYVLWLETYSRVMTRLWSVEYKLRTQPKQSKPRTTEGFVYLIQGSNAYKIGRAKDPNNRIKTFNVRLPFEVEYLHLIETPDMYTLESQLHQRFASKRVNGEWFRLDMQDIDYIKSL